MCLSLKKCCDCRVTGEDFLDITKRPTKIVVGVQAAIVTAMYMWFVLLRWGSFIPILMFYQHYFSAISSGFGCLVTVLQLKVVIWAQVITAFIGVLCGCFYLGQLMTGAWTDNFLGTVAYPKGNSITYFNITAQNETIYDYSYALFTTNIALTFVEIIGQNLIMNVILPIYILSKVSEGAFNESNYEAGVCTRAVMSAIGTLIVITGVVQGGMSLYFLFAGILPLTLITNLNYYVYFITAAGLIPALRCSKTEDIIALSKYNGEADYYSDTRPSAYNFIYLIALILTWVTTGGSIIANINWSNENNLGGALCPTSVNASMVMYGAQTLRYADTQLITYQNLTSTVSGDALTALEDRTTHNVEAITNYSCADIWINAIIFILFTVFIILHGVLIGYKKCCGRHDQNHTSLSTMGITGRSFGM